jgi:hypothetical protein
MYKLPTQEIRLEVMMNNKRTILVIFIVLASVLLIAAVPVNQGLNQLDKSALVRLTIENRTTDYVTLKLDGPAFYYLYVKPGETRIYTPMRGEYSYVLYSCGVFVNGTLDLSKQHKIVSPACGTKGGEGTKGQGTTDSSKLIKLVKVYIENKTTGNMIVVLEGPAEFVFFVKQGKTNSYTIPRGEYKSTLYACGKIKYANYYAYAHKEKTFTCPP